MQDPLDTGRQPAAASAAASTASRQQQTAQVAADGDRVLETLHQGLAHIQAGPACVDKSADSHIGKRAAASAAASTASRQQQAAQVAADSDRVLETLHQGLAHIQVNVQMH